MISVNRRKFLGTGAGGMGLLGLAGAMPAWARGGDLLAGNARKGLDEVAGPNIDLTVARSAFASGNRRGGAIAVNGSIPGPLLRLQEGALTLFQESGWAGLTDQDGGQCVPVVSPSGQFDLW